MKRTLVVLALAFLACPAGSLPRALADPAPPDSMPPATAPTPPPGIVTRVVAETPLADAPGKKLTVVRVKFAPGASLPSHRHGGTVIVLVLEGAVRSQVGDAPARTYRAGESWIEPPGAEHRVCINLSLTDPAEIVAMLVSDFEAAPPADEAPPDTIVPSRR